MKSCVNVCDLHVFDNMHLSWEWMMFSSSGISVSTPTEGELSVTHVALQKEDEFVLAVVFWNNLNSLSECQRV